MTPRQISPGEIAKAKLHSLAEPLGWKALDIGGVGRWKTSRKESEIQPLVGALKSTLLQWRAE
jgi:predicted dinucleotide-binding enzyme